MMERERREFTSSLGVLFALLLLLALVLTLATAPSALARSVSGCAHPRYEVCIGAETTVVHEVGIQHAAVAGVGFAFQIGNRSGLPRPRAARNGIRSRCTTLRTSSTCISRSTSKSDAPRR